MKHELLPLTTALSSQSQKSASTEKSCVRKSISKLLSINCCSEAAVDKCVECCGNGMYWIGPLFVITGLGIIAFAMYVGFGILLPAKCEAWSVPWVRHHWL